MEAPIPYGFNRWPTPTRSIQKRACHRLSGLLRQVVNWFVLLPRVFRKLKTLQILRRKSAGQALTRPWWLIYILILHWPNLLPLLWKRSGLIQAIMSTKEPASGKKYIPTLNTHPNWKEYTTGLCH